MNFDQKPKAGLAQAFQQNIEQKRVIEAEQASLNKYLKDISIYAGHPKSEKKVEAAILASRQKKIAQELEMNSSLIASEQKEAIRVRTTALEEKLGFELAQRESDKVRKETEVKLICATDDTIINLKKKLAVAEMNKARKVMAADTRARLEKERQQEIDEETAREKMKQAADHLPAQLLLEKRLACKNEQMEQIKYRQQQRDFSLREAERERAQVDEIVSKIAEEDRVTEATKKAFQEAACKELNDFRVHKAKFDADQREKERKEDEEREAYAKMKRDQEAAVQAAKEAAEEAARKAFFSNIQMLEQQSNDAAELEHLINELAYEQMEEDARIKQALEDEKKVNDRRTMAEAADASKARKAADKLREQEEEVEFRRRYFEQIERDNNIELMNKKTRQKMIQEHNRIVIEQWQDKRAKYENALNDEREEHARDLAAEVRRKQIVEAETRRLLVEHAAKYVNDLPKGVYRSRDDLNLVAEAANQ